jgi:Mn2+/Fe2+ NRAMP family transporter
MSESPAEITGVERDRALIVEAKKKGGVATIFAYFKLSGPGWLQSAITLGGGSLAGSLYLGVLGGFALMWLQPFAMILGIIMLSAIGYVTLSTGERPFRAINRHVSPVLGWGWIIATLMANCVWALPQFSLGTAAIQQNLMPGLFGASPGDGSKFLVCIVIALLCSGIVWFYDSGSRGVRAFEIVLKVIVGLIMLCFFGVVIQMSTSGLLDWGAIFKGFIPRLSMLSSPAETFTPFLNDVSESCRGFWSSLIVGQQRDVMVTAAATAVGINMTFLLPYSMLKRGWNRSFRGLAIFDLATGLFIPFVLATGCVVIASATQFHATPAPGFLGERNEQGIVIAPEANLVGRYNGLAQKRLKHELGAEAFGRLTADEVAEKVAALPVADRTLAAMLVKRDAFNLAKSLSPLTGKTVSHYVFGFGVVGMAVSSIIILMLINGFVVCEILNVPATGWPYRIGAIVPGLIGMFGPLVWRGRAAFWLAVPTSVFGMVLLPIAYFTFMLVMNQKKILGDDMPKGRSRIIWNVLMALAAGLAAFGSIWSVWSKAGWYGIGGVVAFTAAAVIVHFVRKAKPQIPAPEPSKEREAAKTG